MTAVWRLPPGSDDQVQRIIRWAKANGIEERPTTNQWEVWRGHVFDGTIIIYRRNTGAHTICSPEEIGDDFRSGGMPYWLRAQGEDRYAVSLVDDFDC